MVGVTVAPLLHVEQSVSWISSSSLLDRIVVETDAPFLALTPHSKRNEPVYLTEISR